MKQEKQNKFQFNFESKEVKKNGRKFGEIVFTSEKQIDVRITTKQHRGTGEIMIFHIVPNEDENQN